MGSIVPQGPQQVEAGLVLEFDIKEDDLRVGLPDQLDPAWYIVCGTQQPDLRMPPLQEVHENIPRGFLIVNDHCGEHSGMVLGADNRIRPWPMVRGLVRM